MLKTEWTTRGLGFFLDGDGTLPSFDQCRAMVQEAAYFEWLQEGQPHNDAMKHWLAAEAMLFSGYCNGYCIYVCDRTRSRRILHWNEITVPDNGARAA